MSMAIGHRPILMTTPSLMKTVLYSPDYLCKAYVKYLSIPEDIQPNGTHGPYEKTPGK